MQISPMSQEFHEWLDECPVRWFRDKCDSISATYTFIKNDDN